MNVSGVVVKHGASTGHASGAAARARADAVAGARQRRGGDGVEDRTARALDAFDRWLSVFGEDSHDFQTWYAGPYGKFAKALYYRNRLGVVAVAPMVLCEAVAPSARRLFFKPQRFPIADAHYAMGFARLFQATGSRRHLERASHFLQVLSATSCPGPSGRGWGYPFDWVTIDGTIPAGTPLITTLPYVYEAFAALYAIERRTEWRDVMRSIATHARLDYRNVDCGGGAGAACYTPLASDRGRVVNASAYRAFLLTRAALDFGEDGYLAAARPNLRFVLRSQNGDGSWPYAADGRRGFIDHFHTCFVLKGLVKVEQLTGDREIRKAIDAGVAYYLQHLFDEEGLPRPFARAPRLTVYRRELYDYAEAINLLTLLGGRSAEIDTRRRAVLEDVLSRWQRRDGSFRTRQLRIGWDDVPMHRWAQAQMFRSLTGILLDERQSDV